LNRRRPMFCQSTRGKGVPGKLIILWWKLLTSPSWQDPKSAVDELLPR
jgi:hypothetical protein